jgi:hypothetical protein
MPSESILRINSIVPLGDWIYWRFKVACGELSDTVYRESHQFDRSYLAWETVRKVRNPYFEKGTGFEGYYVGICRSPDEVLGRILMVSQQILSSIGRLYRFNHRFRSALVKTLVGEQADPKAMAEWSAQLGAALARLRCNIIHNQQGDAFRTETYRIVNTLPPIDYRECDHVVRQLYTIDSFDRESIPKLVVNLDGLDPSDQDSWLVAESIGKFGHPLLREFVRYCVN